MATKKFWHVFEIEDKESCYGNKRYETVDSAVIAAKQRTAKSSTSSYGIFELVQQTQPVVPEVSIEPLTA